MSRCALVLRALVAAVGADQSLVEVDLPHRTIVSVIHPADGTMTTMVGNDGGAGDHYFTGRPASADERRRISVRLAGREVEVEVAGGVFSPGGLDKGTSVLLDAAPRPPAGGTFLDLGCGWGPIALTLGLLSPAANVWGVDVNERALALLRTNAARLDLERVRAALPSEVPAGARFDVIWSNPPIRIGKPALHELLRTWLPRLDRDGRAYLVVSKNLGGDSLQRWVETELGLPCRRYASAKGFRVLTVAGAGEDAEPAS